MPWCYSSALLFVRSLFIFVLVVTQYWIKRPQQTTYHLSLQPVLLQLDDNS